MGQTADLTGHKFGKLTALELAGKDKCHYALWKCRCDCGNECFVASRNLKNLTTTSCGCGRVPRYINLNGQRFGKLIVIRDAGSSPSKQKQWFCHCDCGNDVVATTGELTSGNRKSCGCLSHPPLKDWIGKQFGDLTVIAYDGKRDGKQYWKCLCKCGNEASVCQTNLMRGVTRSCGCMVDVKKNIHFVDGTCIEQIRSKKVASNNTSGIRGVYFASRRNRWVAQITFKGKTKNLGSFLTIEEATKARRVAEEMFDEFLEEYEKAHAPSSAPTTAPTDEQGVSDEQSVTV